MSDKEHLLDEEGFVKDPNLWSEGLAENMADKQFNISMSDLHMKVIRFVREYYVKWGAIPMIKTIRDRFKLNVEQLNEMFKRNKSSARGVICKLAGLPRMLCIASGC